MYGRHLPVPSVSSSPLSVPLSLVLEGGQSHVGVEGAIVVELGRSEGVRGKCRRNRINSCFLEVAKRGERGRVGRVRGLKWGERGRVGRV